MKLQDTTIVRIATYNVHKCRGLDGRVRPERIVKVLSEIDADIVALQEVVCIAGKNRRSDQARFIAEELGYHKELGENRRHKGGAYGNVLLSRFPIEFSRNYDISIRGRENRGCLRADIHLESGVCLHIYNLHLGTSFFERRKQARKLFEEQILIGGDAPGNKIILGDFNEWTRGLASRMLHSHFKSADSLLRKGRPQTYPGVFPLLHLDHIYFDDSLTLKKITLQRSRTAALASDHLPLVAEFSVPNSTVESPPRALMTSLHGMPSNREVLPQNR